jgi:hypothetical protein
MKTWLSVLIGLTLLGSSRLASAAELPAHDRQANRPALVFVLAGQSNMAGQAPISDDLSSALASVDNVRIFCPLHWFFQDHSAVLRPDRQPVWERLRSCGANERWFGPELTFGLTVGRQLPDYDIYLIKYAHGGTSLFCEWQPNPASPVYVRAGGDAMCVDYLSSFSWKTRDNMWTWERFDATLTMALAQLPQQARPSFGGMLWLQGEADAEGDDRWPFMAQDYRANLSEFIDTLRRRLAQPGLPFVMGQIKCGSDRASWGNPLKTVRDAQRELAATKPGVMTFDTWDLSMQEEVGDCCHFSAASIKTIGERYALALGLADSGALRYPPPAERDCRQTYGVDPP